MGNQLVSTAMGALSTKRSREIKITWFSWHSNASFTNSGAGMTHCSNVLLPGLVPLSRQLSEKLTTCLKSRFCLGKTTKVPFPCLRFKSPCYTRLSTAFFTVIVLTPNWAASSASDGRRIEGWYSPVWILRRSISSTCWYSGTKFWLSSTITPLSLEGKHNILYDYNNIIIDDCQINSNKIAYKSCLSLLQL